MSRSDMESSSTLWEFLVRNHHEIVTASEFSTLARKLGYRPEHVIRHLRRARYLEPLFKGYYRVCSPEEVRLRNPRLNPLELFAMAAKAKGIGVWYFGLHTALRLNGLTHEDRREETVISGSFYRIHGVRIGGRRFIINKWSLPLLSFGLRSRGTYRYSDPEKTVLDLAYWDYWRVRKGRTPTLLWKEYAPTVSSGTLRRYLWHYPEEIRRAVERAI